MAKHNVICLECGQTFDANAEEYEKEGKRYLHKQCFENRRKNELFLDDIHLYMKTIFGQGYSKTKIDKQIKELMDDGKEIEWINKSLKYWYAVKGSDPSKAGGGIRIVNYIYDEAKEYYKKMKSAKEQTKDIDKNFLNKEIEYIKISPEPITKPKRVKLFELN